MRRRALSAVVGALLLAGCHRVGTLRGEAGPASGEGTPVRVVSYNVWGLPLSFAQDTESRMKRLPDALRSFDADVICLQEVWVPAVRAQIAAALAPAYSAAKSVQGGLLVLSRLPILEERFVAYPQPPDLSLVERLANKGVLEVLFETAEGPLRVVTTHMVAFNRKAREEGLPTLVSVVEARRDVPLVLAGDLNVARLDDAQRSLSKSYRRLLEAGCVDCDPPVRLEDGTWAEGPNTHVGWPRSKDDEGWWRPDHVLVRSGASAEASVASARMALDTPETALSDHNLMFAEVRLKRRK